MDWTSGRGRHCVNEWLVIVVGAWLAVGLGVHAGIVRNDLVDRISVGRNGSKNGYTNEYGTGNAGIRVEVEL